MRRLVELLLLLVLLLPRVFFEEDFRRRRPPVVICFDPFPPRVEYSNAGFIFYIQYEKKLISGNHLPPGTSSAPRGLSARRLASGGSTSATTTALKTRHLAYAFYRIGHQIRSRTFTTSCRRYNLRRGRSHNNSSIEFK